MVDQLHLFYFKIEMEFDLAMKIKDEDLNEYGSKMGLSQNSFSHNISIMFYFVHLNRVQFKM